ncbi:MAG: glycosyltransferase family 1 protein [Bacteroidota bacterium]
MKIAVNTRFLLNEYLEGYGYFLYETFKRITQDHPEHDFIFIFDRPFDQRFVFGSNVKKVVVGPPARHPLLWKFWYDVRIPSVVERYNADVFVSCDGFCSSALKLPQVIAVHDLSFLHYPSFIQKSHLLFYKRYIPQFLHIAKSVVTVSEFSKRDIITQYKIDPVKIDVVFSAAKEIFKSLNEEERQKTKNRYTDGKEYFVYAGAIHPRKNLINLLKAFSVFKKRQQSNLKLVLAGRLAWKYGSFIHDLKTYKYRDDVIMTGYINEKELAKVIGSAYALVYPSFFEGFGVPVLEAMQCNVPVITSKGSSMEEIAGNAALYADADNYNEIAEKMMLIYKDENLRNELVQRGKNIAGQFSWQKTADLLWQSILKAVS